MKGDRMPRIRRALVLVVVPLLAACGQTISGAEPGTAELLEAPAVTPPVSETGDFALAPAESLPSDAACASRVVPTGEVRPGNRPFNQTRGRQQQLPGPFLSRVSGNFTGTTDEIIQWATCKWGIDTDVVRAQSVQESSWRMTKLGDFTDDSQWCAPGHVPGGDGIPGCPQSVGILQVKYRYHGVAFPMAAESTAHNLDYALAVWRTCFEGQEPWLADQPPASGYNAGDMWGCLGRWFSGKWRDGAALSYISRVQTHYRERAWQADWFLADAEPKIVSDGVG